MGAIKHFTLAIDALVPAIARLNLEEKRELLRRVKAQLAEGAEQSGSSLPSIPWKQAEGQLHQQPQGSQQ